MTFYISPYRRMTALRQAMDRMLDESLAEAAPAEHEMLLIADVKASDDEFTITALVPGLAAEDLNIEVLKNTVTIRGEFKGREDEQARYLARELPTGRFSRVITLPVAVDATKTEASLKNGVLTLRAPKAEAHRPKAIHISAN